MAASRRLQSSVLSPQSFKLLVLLSLAVLIGACQPQTITRIALLAPFEGRYRDVGYQAYYAARLALQDYGDETVELLAVDDGGTVASAVDRTRALVGDPLVKAVVVLGYAATDSRVQRAFGDLPVMIAGHWGARPETDRVLMLANPELDTVITAPPRLEITRAAALQAPLVGGEVFALEALAELRNDLDGITIATSAALPDAAFQRRYRASAEFAPEPGLLATLAYDAVRLALTDTGGSGNGYLPAASVYFYRYGEGGQLTPVDRPVE